MPDYRPEIKGGSALTWAGCLARHLGCSTLINMAQSGAGSPPFIQRTVMAGVARLLHEEAVPPEDICVGVMWSHLERWEVPSGKTGWENVFGGTRSSHALTWYRHFHSDYHALYLRLQSIALLQAWLRDRRIRHVMLSLTGSAMGLDDPRVALLHREVDLGTFYFAKHSSVPTWSFKEWATDCGYPYALSHHFVAQAHEDFVEQGLGPFARRLFAKGE